MTKLPDSVMQFPLEFRSLGEWHPAMNLGIDPDSGDTVVAYRIGTTMYFANFSPSLSDQLLRPRVEKRKRWVMLDSNNYVYARTDDEEIARSWCYAYPQSTDYSIIEYTPGERPTFDEPKDEEPVELKPGMRVRVRKPDEPLMHSRCNWIPDMDRFDGMIATLSTRDAIDGTWRIMETQSFYFHPDWLTPIEENESK